MFRIRRLGVVGTASPTLATDLSFRHGSGVDARCLRRASLQSAKSYSSLEAVFYRLEPGAIVALLPKGRMPMFARHQGSRISVINVVRLAFVFEWVWS